MPLAIACSSSRRRGSATRSCRSRCSRPWVRPASPRRSMSSHRRGVGRCMRECAASVASSTVRRRTDSSFCANGARSASRCARSVTRTPTCCRTRGSRRSFPGSRAYPERIGYSGEARYGLLTRCAQARPAGDAATRHALCSAGHAARRAGRRAAGAGARPRRTESRRRDATRSVFRANGRSQSCVPAPNSARPNAGPPNISRRWRSALRATAMRSGSWARPTTRRWPRRSCKRWGRLRRRCAISPGAPILARRSI